MFQREINLLSNSRCIYNGCLPWPLISSYFIKYDGNTILNNVHFNEIINNENREWSSCHSSIVCETDTQCRAVQSCFLNSFMFSIIVQQLLKWNLSSLFFKWVGVSLCYLYLHACVLNKDCIKPLQLIYCVYFGINHSWQSLIILNMYGPILYQKPYSCTIRRYHASQHK